MLGSPSFHSYRDANGGNGKSSVEMGSGLYYGDQSYSVCTVLTVFFICSISVLFC